VQIEHWAEDRAANNEKRRTNADMKNNFFMKQIYDD